MMNGDNSPNSPVKSSEDIFREKKREIARKFLWITLSIFAVIILLVGFILICTAQGRSLKKTETEKTAINALKLKVENPSSLKILDISQPDSVFQNRICPEYEIMELTDRFLEYSIAMMQDSQNGMFENDNTAYKCRMDRYSECSNFLNTINSMMEKPQGKHCGWRVKIRYQSTDDSDTPYTSEAWFIFDKDKKHILNSFDISLL